MFYAFIESASSIDQRRQVRGKGKMASRVQTETLASGESGECNSGTYLHNVHNYYACGTLQHIQLCIPLAL